MTRIEPGGIACGDAVRFGMLAVRGGRFQKAEVVRAAVAPEWATDAGISL